MSDMDAWDVVLFGFAAVVAVTTLVRLMAARRQELVDQLRRQLDAERARQEKEQKKNKNKDAA